MIKYLKIFKKIIDKQATLQKKEVWAEQNVPSKCFKLCYIFCSSTFSLMNALMSTQTRAFSKRVKCKVGRNENEKKTYMGFLIGNQNIANFEAFRCNILLRANLLFLKCEGVIEIVQTFFIKHIHTSFKKYYTYQIFFPYLI